jgi:hypothetical protein
MPRRFAWMLIGLLSLLVAAELLCRLLPVSSSTETGYYLNSKILSYPPHHAWRAATGWDLRNAQLLRSNNQGFAAGRDFKPGEDAVALVGDSYVEASMLPAADRPGAQLERALGGRPVYAMGSPGTALLDYAERIRWAHEAFGVRDAVVFMEAGDVRQSLCGSGNVNSECLDAKTFAPRSEPLPPPSTAKRWLRRSALAQYLFSQLKLSPDRLWEQARQQSRPAQGHDVGAAASAAPRRTAAPADLALVDKVAAEFFNRVRPHVPGRLILVVDAPRAAIARGEDPPDAERQHFIALARQAGAQVIDGADLYRAHFRQSGLSLNVGPYDGHLNPLGVRLLTAAAAEALLSAPR